ncbi:MAG: PAS domain S-box protein [Bacteroidota bacterium]|nr:PAS domain S-box protein [Bacteroidota bacterium]
MKVLKKKIFYESLFIIIGAFLIYLISDYFNLYLKIVSLGNYLKFYKWNLDDIFVVFIYLCFVSFLFSFRRLKEIYYHINKLREAENNLKIKEQQFKTFFEEVRNGILIYEAIDNGSDFIIKNANKAAERIDCFNREDVIGKNVTSVFPTIKEYGLWDLLIKVYNTGNPEHNPVFFYKDERIKGWRENYVYKLPSGEIVSIFDDITDFKWIEEAKKDIENKFRNLIENTNEWIWQINEDNHFIYHNPKVQDILGFSPAELMARTPFDILDPEDSQTKNVLIEILKNKSKMNLLENSMIHKNGNIIFLETNASPMYNLNGEYIGYIGASRDITDRRHAEETLKQAYEDLELKVQQRTFDLTQTNETLKFEIQERKKAEDHINNSLEEKKVLLKEIYHRVKNNLQVISALLNLQSNYIKDDLSKTIFKECQNRVMSMSMVHEMLYRSSNLSRIDYKEYIRDLISNLTITYNTNPDIIKIYQNIEEISLNIDTSIPLGLIITELVSNCLKYAFPDNRKGEIKIDLIKDPDNYWILSIKDNGIGLPRDLEINKTNSLGLRLVVSLTNQIEGSLDITNNDGTEFNIKFLEISN